MKQHLTLISWTDTTTLKCGTVGKQLTMCWLSWELFVDCTSTLLQKVALSQAGTSPLGHSALRIALHSHIV